MHSWLSIFRTTVGCTSLNGKRGGVFTPYLIFRSARKCHIWQGAPRQQCIYDNSASVSAGDFGRGLLVGLALHVAVISQQESKGWGGGVLLFFRAVTDFWGADMLWLRRWRERCGKLTCRFSSEESACAGYYCWACNLRNLKRLLTGLRSPDACLFFFCTGSVRDLIVRQSCATSYHPRYTGAIPWQIRWSDKQAGWWSLNPRHGWINKYP